jgi:hypothetical protein
MVLDNNNSKIDMITKVFKLSGGIRTATMFLEDASEYLRRLRRK